MTRHRSSSAAGGGPGGRGCARSRWPLRSSNDNKSSSRAAAPRSRRSSGQKKGGTLKVLSAEGFEHLDPGHVVLPARLRGGLRHAAAAVLVQARGPDHAGARPGGLRSADVGRREDGHDQDPPERQVQPARQPRGDVQGRQVRASSAASTRTWPTATRAVLLPATSRAADKAKGGRSPASRRPTTRRSSSSSPSRSARPMAKALSLPLSAPVPKEYVEQDQRRRQDPERLRLRSRPSRRSPGRTSSSPTRPARASRWSATRTGTARPPATSARPTSTRSNWQIGTDPNVSGRQILTGQDLVNGDTPARADDQARRSTQAQGPDQLHPAGQPLHRA